MRALEYHVNVVLYGLFRFEKATQRMLEFPVRWVLRRRSAQGAARRRGAEEMEARMVQSFDDPETGVASALCAAHLTILLVLALWGTQCFLMAAMPTGLSWSTWLLAPAAVGGFVLSGMLAYRNDKYLRYFREFDSKPAAWRRKTAIGSFLAVVGTWLYGIAGSASLMRAIHG